uniref:protein FAM161B-like n=1 Tax=Styela clava TaxID=7725 RepID=UPI0019395C15|nr:protein FAM161B-like [Styela clava]
MADHQTFKLTSGMIRPPLKPGTNTIATLHDEDREQHMSTMQECFNEDSLAVYQPEPEGFRPMTDVERNPGIEEPFHVDRDKLTKTFYDKLQDLKNEHQKTLKMLDLLYSEADSRCHQAKNYLSNQKKDAKYKVTQNGFVAERNQREGVFLTEEDSVDSYEGNRQNQDEVEQCDSESEIEDENRSAIEYQHSGRIPNGYSNELRHDRVKEMWDDFKLKDYLPPTSIEKIERAKEKRSRPKSAPIKKDWSPIITIPKPFKMTIREENKKEKTHTRSSEEVARAERERLEQEELEMRLRVRAKDPPAHTFLPLYEEIMERQEQRSRMNRENAVKATQAMIKPFSFMEREKMKEMEKQKTKRMEQKKEKNKLKTMVQFIARPVPASVHDPSVAEKMKEEQLYRKIKVKLRSEDLMQSSSLPPRMHSHELMYAQRRKQRHKDIKKATKLSFRPETHDMPDFEALHRRYQMEQTARKMELETTMTEPFQLRTEALRKKKVAMLEANRKLTEDEENYRNSMKSLKTKKYSYPSDSIPARMTESARLRIEETKKAIAKAEEELLELKLKERARKERRKIMAQEVATRAMTSDKDLTESTEYRKEKLKQYKLQQKARNAEYQKELKDINERVKQRPLLFEQQAQNSARLKAEKRYKEILRNSGLNDDMFDENTGRRKMNGNTDRSIGDEDDYSDDDFETSIVRSGPPTSSQHDSKNYDKDSG